ncbi:hypothetical protein [Blastococcus brunescens]|uniref:Uncharacterized protein n=1 Tax=Blastococcus brunescens TaxID=1564165 RepID=A0ABZ1ATX6_9ACTN|nr:hypothetical protein [Blastococcus sp. BMG 8361]WRL62017.1 hypothetical protein U6N30_18260 [Blastococcus sp. BMG 8361]
MPAGVVGALAVLYGADLALASGDIPRSTVVAGVDIGGLSPQPPPRPWRRTWPRGSTPSTWCAPTT